MGAPVPTMTFAAVQSLSEVTSVPNRTLNRAWLALMTIAILVLIPRDGTKPFDLPFAMGAVTPEAFFAVSLTMLVAVTIAFAAAHAQALRALEFARGALSNLPLDATADPTDIHPRDLFDLLQEPSMNHVGPLAQLARGKHKSFPGAVTSPPSLRRFATLYYLVLKLVAFGFYFVIPSYALWHAFSASQLIGALRWLGFVGVSVAAIALLQVMVAETWHIYRSVRSGLRTTAPRAAS